MFTIKFYSEDGYRTRIMSAESFTILRGVENGSSEITLHQKNISDSMRIDIGSPRLKETIDMPPIYQKAIIENANGRTTEIIGINQMPN